MDELLQMEDIDKEDYVSITLTDEKELYRPKDVLGEVYPRILEITVDNTRTRNIYAGFDSEAEEEMRLETPLEAFREFYQLMQQQPLSEAEESVIVELLEHAGGDVS